MNTFFGRAFTEYKRQKRSKKAFTTHTKRLSSIVGNATQEEASRVRSGREADGYPSRAALAMLTPLIEVAWADGRVSRRELEVIAQAADAYRLVKDERGYQELIERLMSRPAPHQVAQMWRELACLMESIPERDRRTMQTGLLTQTSFLAEQGPDGILAFLRGEAVRPEEREALEAVAAQFENAKSAAEEADIQKHVAAQIQREERCDVSKFSGQDKTTTQRSGLPTMVHAVEELDTLRSAGSVQEADRKRMVNTLHLVETKMIRKRMREIAESNEAVGFDSSKIEPIGLVDDLDKLIPLVPLVKVAWAEGRITNRERELIFSAAERMGVAAGSASHERLASWLEVHPPDEFYFDSLDRLNSSWGTLPDEEKNLRRLDLLSDCVNVAEASGGTKRYPAGGRRVCDEEFAAVKRIADKLRPTAFAGAL